ncbi:fumarylacetoacetate hydrolase family protein [Paraburkholderia flava]|uniref:fumarylacetoacetate hydrolase family protein n=1 Tax=Paraburkholderia flava TaxID=2547393 RepID=UPI00105EA182|nr:fumarylacetoacetate hydrolase family protein [Paraburkholderia flava]
MVQFAIPAPAVTSVAIAGSDERFPVRRVFCVGRNYADHALEMGGNPDREPPFFFQKPTDAVVPAAGTIPYPPLTRDLHHEIEMVIAIGKEGTNVAAGDALDLVWGYGLGVDLTRRDLQGEAKKTGRPWDWGKGFDASAPVTPLHPVSAVGHLGAGRIWLSVNGTLRQQGDLNQLIWPVADIIRYVSESVTLKPGDLIFSGTPAGVAALQPGDTVQGGLEGIGEFEFKIGAAANT